MRDDSDFGAHAEKVRREYEEIVAIIEEARTRLAELEATAQQARETLELLQGGERSGKDGSALYRETFAKLSKTKAAQAILFPKRRMLTRDLLREMTKRGYEFRGKHPSSNLSAALISAPLRFARDESGRWYAKDSKGGMPAGTHRG